MKIVIEKLPKSIEAKLLVLAAELDLTPELLATTYLADTIHHAKTKSERDAWQAEIDRENSFKPDKPAGADMIFPREGERKAWNEY